MNSKSIVSTSEEGGILIFRSSHKEKNPHSARIALLKYRNDKNKTHSWFVGFARSDDDETKELGILALIVNSGDSVNEALFRTRHLRQCPEQIVPAGVHEG